MQSSDQIAQLKRIYRLAKPYGIKKMGITLFVSLVQGFLQVAGVGSIFPFLALAANPEGFRSSGMGRRLMEIWPDFTDQQLLMYAGIFAIAMLLVSNVALMLGELVRARYAHGFGHWLRLRLLSQMASNPYGYFLQRNSGELLKKAVGDVMAYINGMLIPLLDMFARGFLIVLLLALLMWVHPLVTSVAFLVLGLIYTAMYFSMKGLRARTSDGLKVHNRGSMKQAIQVLSGIKPIKIHGVERPFLDKYAYASGRQAALLKWIPLMNNLPRYVIEPIAFGGIILFLLILLGRGQSIQEVLPVLGVMAFAGYRLLPNLQLMYHSFSQMSVSSHALEEIEDEFKTVAYSGITPFFDGPWQRPKPMSWQRQFELQSVSFCYPGQEKPTLDNLSLVIPKNQFFAFIGETGSGKSTLIDLIMGLHEPTSGSLLVDGVVLSEKNIRSWRAGIGYVPQELFLSDDTIAANIAFGVNPTQINWERIRSVVEAAQLKRFIEEELPDNYKTMVGERGVRLSGGQRQRLGLARALYHEPELLVLDEATSALDESTEAALMEAIENVRGKISLIVIAHRLSTIRKADCVVRLNKGRIETQGTFAEVVGE